MELSRKILLFSLVILNSVLVQPVSARGVRGIDFPDTLTVEKTKLLLNGIGLRTKTIFHVEVYLGALYLEKRSNQFREVLASSQNKAIELVFLRNVDAKAVIEALTDGFDKNCQDQCKTLQPSLQKLTALITDVKEKQRIRFAFDQKGLTVSTAGNTKDIPGKDFAKIVLATFIGEDPPTTELRNGMMGLKED